MPQTSIPEARPEAFVDAVLDRVRAECPAMDAAPVVAKPTNLDKLKAHLEQHGHATTREIREALGWKGGQAASIVSRAHTYGHIEIAGRQRSTPTHFEMIWRLRRPPVVRQPRAWDQP